MNFSIGNTKKCQSIELQSSWYDYLEYGYRLVGKSNHENGFHVSSESWYNYESGSPISSESWYTTPPAVQTRHGIMHTSLLLLRG